MSRCYAICTRTCRESRICQHAEHCPEPVHHSRQPLPTDRSAVERHALNRIAFGEVSLSGARRIAKAGLQGEVAR